MGARGPSLRVCYQYCRCPRCASLPVCCNAWTLVAANRCLWGLTCGRYGSARLTLLPCPPSPFYAPLLACCLLVLEPDVTKQWLTHWDFREHNEDVFWWKFLKIISSAIHYRVQLTVKQQVEAERSKDKYCGGWWVVSIAFLLLPIKTCSKAKNKHAKMYMSCSWMLTLNYLIRYVLFISIPPPPPPSSFVDMGSMFEVFGLALADDCCV